MMSDCTIYIKGYCRIIFKHGVPVDDLVGVGVGVAGDLRTECLIDAIFFLLICLLSYVGLLLGSSGVSLI